MPLDKQAIDAVKAQTPDGSRFKVTGTIDNVLGGTIVFVEFEHEEDVWNEKYALFKGDTIHVIANSQELATMVSQWQPQPTLLRALQLVAQPNVMAALISFVIIAVLGALAIAGKGDGPAYLINAFTLVLGFYFGTKTSK